MRTILMVLFVVVVAIILTVYKEKQPNYPLSIPPVKMEVSKDSLSSLPPHTSTSDFLLPVTASIDGYKQQALKTNPNHMYVLSCLKDGKVYAIWCGKDFIIPMETK